MWLLLVGVVIVIVIVVVAVMLGSAGMTRNAPDPSEGKKD